MELCGHFQQAEALLGSTAREAQEVGNDLLGNMDE